MTFFPIIYINILHKYSPKSPFLHNNVSKMAFYSLYLSVLTHFKMFIEYFNRMANDSSGSHQRFDDAKTYYRP